MIKQKQGSHHFGYLAIGKHWIAYASLLANTSQSNDFTKPTLSGELPHIVHKLLQG